ncbi:IS30 family transposase (plasmid) [Acinetobacter baumannii]
MIKLVIYFAILKRFFAGQYFDYRQISQLIFNMFSFDQVQLTLDRTNWKWGKLNINILMLAIVYRGIAIPILWTLLNKRGNSDTKERIALIQKGELKKDLLSCLRHENKKRKANGEPKKDSILQDIKTIHERPAEVQERKIPGHWEADLIKGKDNKSSIATLIERNTRLCILATLPDAKAESVRKALTEALKYLPAELRKTLTYDRGREMSEHKILEEDLGIDVYFCDPHSPWQKGTCENMNGLIRQYLPKGIDLNQADQHYLNQVAMSLNTRPRKALDWLTPLEKFAQLVDYHMAFETVAPHV